MYPTITTPDDVATYWQDLLALIPCDVHQAALDTYTIKRIREVRSGEDLLRLCWAYSLGLSLREVAAWAHTAGIATLHETSVRDRYRTSGYWVASLLATVLTTDLPAAPTALRARRIRLVDATVVCRPGATGTDFRLHLSLDLPRQVFDEIRLTDAHGGEDLQHLALAPHDLLIADRGYCTRANIVHVRRHDADLIVRVNRQNLPLQTREGTPCEILATVRTLAPGATGSWEVQTAPTGTLPAVPGRLIALHLPPAEAAKARDAAAKQARKAGKPPAADTLEAAEYVILFTTLSAAAASTALVLALYRMRWQIEIAIKRVKSDLHLDHLRAKDTAVCETYLLATMLLAVLLDRLRERHLAFSPSGPAPPLVSESAHPHAA